MFLLFRRRETKKFEPIDEKFQVKPFNAVQPTLTPIDGFSPTTSDPRLDPHPQPQMLPFLTGRETRKGQIPALRYNANPGEMSDRASTSVS